MDGEKRKFCLGECTYVNWRCVPVIVVGYLGDMVLAVRPYPGAVVVSYGESELGPVVDDQRRDADKEKA